MRMERMKTRVTTTAILAVLTLGATGGTGLAQDATAPAAVAPVVEELMGEQDWHPFSRSAVRIYMADVKSLTLEGDVTRVTVAKPPLQGEAGDYSRAEEVVEFKCGAKQSRSTTETEYGPDGVRIDQYEDPSPWEPYGETSRDAFLAAIVCDGERAPAPTWPSIRAWVDAGRK